MKKIMVKVVGERISPYDFDTSLRNVKKQIEELIDKYGEEASLDYSSTGYLYGDDSPEFQIVTTREETDKELATRISETEVLNKLLLEKEKMEFERLRVKFGK